MALTLAAFLACTVVPSARQALAPTDEHDSPLGRANGLPRDPAHMQSTPLVLHDDADHLLPLDLSKHFHLVDVVIDDEHKLVYVDNVKAASTTLRSALNNTFNATWECAADNWKKHASAQCCKGNFQRTTSVCLTQVHREQYYHFTTVRHPVKKFESGVVEAWYQHTQLRKEMALQKEHPTADSMLDGQLAKFEEAVRRGERCDDSPGCVAIFLDEHLEPSPFRLSGHTSEGRPVKLDALVRTEHFSEDMDAAAKTYRPLAPLTLSIEHARQQESIANSKHAHPETFGIAKLSAEGVRRFCAPSSFYAHHGEVALPALKRLSELYDCLEVPTD